MPRTDPRGGPQTRARISETATRMFLERGFDSVTVAEVAREAGVSSVTVFNHFPRKEDLLLDRAADAIELLRSAVRDRGPGLDVLDSLQSAVQRLFDERQGLSGVADGSAPFLRTVAASPALLARAREIAAEIQAALARELASDRDLAGDADLFAALFLAGYTTVLVENARRLIAGESSDAVTQDLDARLGRLFDVLCHGVGA